MHHILLDSQVNVKWKIIHRTGVLAGAAGVKHSKNPSSTRRIGCRLMEFMGIFPVQTGDFSLRALRLPTLATVARLGDSRTIGFSKQGVGPMMHTYKVEKKEEVYTTHSEKV